MTTEESKQKSGSMIQLSWQDAFNSGNEIIDKQHRKLFTLSNALMEVSGRPHPHALEVTMFKAIIDHVVEHFRDEEEILHSIGFPEVDLQMHKDSHLLLKSSMAELLEDLENKRINAADIFMVLVNEVVVNHLMDDDVKFFELTRRKVDQNHR